MDNTLSSVNTPRKSPRRIILGLIISGFIILSLPLFFFFVEPSSPPQNILISNITNRQATVSWTTSKPTRSVILVSADNKFPLSPLFEKRIYKDDGEKQLKDSNFYNTHHVTVGGLSSNKTFYLRIYQGLKKAYEGQFKTGPDLTGLVGPDPVYGRVLLADKKSPSVGSVVYLYIKNPKGNSSVLSTLTNSGGRWSLDLANLRSSNLKTNYKTGTSSAEILLVETGRGKFKAETEVGKDKPWQDVIVQ